MKINIKRPKQCVVIDDLKQGEWFILNKDEENASYCVLGFRPAREPCFADRVDYFDLSNGKVVTHLGVTEVIPVTIQGVTVVVRDS